MKLLLAQSSVYVPTFGGANKSNRLLMEALAERGHECRAVAPLGGVQSDYSRDAVRAAVVASGGRVLPAGADGDRFDYGGVCVQTVANPARLLASLEREVVSFRPDWVLVSSEDPGQAILTRALRVADGCVVYLARTTLALPCGGAAAVPSVRQTQLLRSVAGIVAVSEYVRSYLRTHAGVDSAVLPISLHQPGPAVPAAEREWVTMINPCAVKGAAIFLTLARAFREVRFAAVPTWGTTAADRRELSACANVTIVAAEEDVDRIYARTRVLLVPSLWAEAKARVILEAMLRSIPVMASDVGGNPEAMLGLDYLLPVTPIFSYGDGVDERMMPVAHVPPQDIEPWAAALAELLGDTERYDALSRAAFERAHQYVARQTVEPFERFLTELTPCRA
jgi:hypothetical protein